MFPTELVATMAIVTISNHEHVKEKKNSIAPFKVILQGGRGKKTKQ